MRRESSNLQSYSFLTPALALYGAFVLLPVAMSVSFSFFDWTGSGSGARPCGFANYAELLKDPVFYRALFNNIMLAIASVAIQIPIALGLALAFLHSTRVSKIMRSLAFSPMVLPSVVIATLFALLYNPFEGPLNNILKVAFGLSPDWLGSETLVMPSLIAAISWRYIGFHMMILLAALSAVDKSLYEAASLDGAGPWRRFWHITLPEIFPSLKLVVLLAVLGSLKYFDLVYIMTRGGPHHSSELLSTYLFKTGINSMRFGYSSAIATLLLLTALIAGALVYSIKQRMAR